MNIDKLLKTYNQTLKDIHEAFGYVEDWVTIPLQDLTDEEWGLRISDGKHKCDGLMYLNGSGILCYGDFDDENNYYESEIYTQRFLPKWIYKTETHTMISVNTGCDGNKYLSILSNDKQRVGEGFVRVEDTWYFTGEREGSQ